MKNKKGFTLIELLVVIAILAVVGTIATVSLTSSLNEANIEQCSEFVIDVEEAACVYAGLKSNKESCNREICPPIKLSALVEQGLLEITTDACTGTDMDLNETVTVTWSDSGEKICEYNGVNTYER